MWKVKAAAERDLMCTVERTRPKIVSRVAEVKRGVNKVLVSGHAVEARQGVRNLETPVFQSARKVGYPLYQLHLQSRVNRPANGEEHFVLTYQWINSSECGARIRGQSKGRCWEAGKVVLS